MSIMLYLVVGLIGGTLSGAFGLGGGAFMVPVFVLFFGLSQHQAQGTSLGIPDVSLKRAFGIFLTIVGIRMILLK